MQRKIKKENSSGAVRLQGDKVLWDLDNKNILQIDLNDIAVIGEYTNSDGPYFDDWFITFVTKDGQWRSIPWYADNIDEVMQYLSDKFDHDLTSTHLANSTEWKSVVRYPSYLEDKELFKLTPSENYKAPKTLFYKILCAVGLGNFNTTQNITLTNEVKNQIANTSR
ncbi:hypothetical protein ACTJIJ_08025 [Niabella sp. 22666]|uniref:hypothetical protein n=1 Tax=Niabella sp. 22666 TaxID=3453954 RepID=UPI003F83BD52